MANEKWRLLSVALLPSNSEDAPYNCVSGLRLPRDHHAGRDALQRLLGGHYRDCCILLCGVDRRLDSSGKVHRTSVETPTGRD